MKQSDVFDNTNKEVIDLGDTVYDLTVLHKEVDEGGDDIIKMQRNYKEQEKLGLRDSDMLLIYAVLSQKEKRNRSEEDLYNVLVTYRGAILQSVGSSIRMATSPLGTLGLWRETLSIEERKSYGVRDGNTRDEIYNIPTSYISIMLMEDDAKNPLQKAISISWVSAVNEYKSKYPFVLEDKFTDIIEGIKNEYGEKVKPKQETTSTPTDALH